jgi:PAS domain S-box-containing protein
MNPAAIEETGYTLEEFSRAPFHDLLHAAPELGGHAAADCPIRTARERLAPLKEHHDLFMRKDGSPFPVACSLSPLQRDGRPAGAVLEFRDISEELAAQKSLEEASRRKDQFLATLSHELRTPMTAVLGWTRMLRLGLPETEAREALAAIERSAAIQAQLIEDVLDVSRITAGKLTFDPVPVDIAPVVRAAMATVHPAAVAKGLEIVASIPPVLPCVLGDEGRLQQIVWNLLANAVKFTPRGGTITLGMVHGGSLLRLTVEDTGKGIEPDYLPHVFEPFTQEDSSTTRAYEGIGLGLSIVRSLVELHGGRVRVSSDGPGRGTTFVVELPVSELPAVRLEKKSALTLPPLSEEALAELDGVRVLVIDDQALTRDLVVAILRHAGAGVDVASSVREGLAQFDAAPPHAVVCDLAMPEADGFAFVRAARHESARPNASTPIIALTAFGRPEDRERALAAGFDDYLRKPVDPAELTTSILRLSRRDRG